MHPYIEYLSGYTTALMLALFSGASVACFMSTNTFLPLAVFATFSCFILNIILYWQSLSHIIALPDKLTVTNAFSILLTTCASLIIYAFSVFSFIELGTTYPIIAILFPPLLIHFISFCCAVGSFALYIDDCINLKKQKIPLMVLFFSLILCGIILYPPPYPLICFSTLTVALYYVLEKKQALCILAIATSMILSISGFGSGLAVLHSFANSQASLVLLQSISYIGLLSLTLCDAVYSYQAMQTFLDNIPTYQSFKEYLSLLFTTSNALANSQITASGKGFFCIEAWLGGAMSFIVMTNNTKELMTSTEKKPTIPTDENLPFLLLAYNTILYLAYKNWLFFYHRKTYSHLQCLLSKRSLGIKASSLIQFSFLSLHYSIWANQIPETKLTSQTSDLATATA
jgi:hypothetical protein